MCYRCERPYCLCIVAGQEQVICSLSQAAEGTFRGVHKAPSFQIIPQQQGSSHYLPYENSQFRRQWQEPYIFHPVAWLLDRSVGICIFQVLQSRIVSSFSGVFPIHCEEPVERICGSRFARLDAEDVICFCRK